jgi:hypothetical protein
VGLPVLQIVIEDQQLAAEYRVSLGRDIRTYPSVSRVPSAKIPRQIVLVAALWRHQPQHVHLPLEGTLSQGLAKLVQKSGKPLLRPVLWQVPAFAGIEWPRTLCRDC